MRNLLQTTLLATTVLLNSCNKSSSSDPTDEKATLLITVRDNLGNIQESADVKLYLTEANLNTQTFQFRATEQTDKNGFVTFTDLPANNYYYWLIEKGCRNNIGGGITSLTPIAEGINKINVIINGKGSIKLTSTSSNPYRIYVNGQQNVDMPGKSSYEIKNLTEGAYSVRVLQLSGYVFIPTDQTYNVSLT